MKDTLDKLLAMVDEYTPEGEREAAREGVKLTLAALASDAPDFVLDEVHEVVVSGTADEIRAKREEITLMWESCECQE